MVEVKGGLRFVPGSQKCFNQLVALGQASREQDVNSPHTGQAISFLFLTCSNLALSVLRTELGYDADWVHSRVLRERVRDNLQRWRIKETTSKQEEESVGFMGRSATHSTGRQKKRCEP